jgi:hypothetical protein
MPVDTGMAPRNDDSRAIVLAVGMADLVIALFPHLSAHPSNAV